MVIRIKQWWWNRLFAGVNCNLCCLFTYWIAHRPTVSVPMSVIAALGDAAISEQLVKISLVVPDVAREVRVEDVSDNMPSLTAGLFALNSTVNISI